MTQEEWLCHYIERAFKEVHLGEGLTIHHAKSLEDYGDCIEDHLAQFAERMDWRQVQAKTLLDRPNAVVFLDPSGFRFYLPALMTLVIKDPAVDGWLVRMLISSLNVDSKGQIHRVPFTSIFSAGQKAAIVRFLKYVIHHRRDFVLSSEEKILVRVQTRT